ncbi:uncharacterized protein LOC132620496 [Lycium barbarum]|uniref:uncharacterized protein LOC132620496 n=1 Tax=Lycium barbarum TaxID=112863 RepID=UPI00293EED68|nr:uncharacterized protein LOC132620496 [Lycium barbarum]
MELVIGLPLNGKKEILIIWSMMIVLFDMQDETFWEMMVPGSLVEKFWFTDDWIAPFVAEESLRLVDHLFDDDKTLDIWMMKEYGDPESWVKQFSISLYHIIFDFGVVDDFFLDASWWLSASDCSFVGEANSFKEKY